MLILLVNIQIIHVTHSSLRCRPFRKFLPVLFRVVQYILLGLHAALQWSHGRLYRLVVWVAAAQTKVGCFGLIYINPAATTPHDPRKPTVQIKTHGPHGGLNSLLKALYPRFCSVH